MTFSVVRGLTVTRVAGFLKRVTIDILNQIILCCGISPVHVGCLPASLAPTH